MEIGSPLCVRPGADDDWVAVRIGTAAIFISPPNKYSLIRAVTLAVVSGVPGAPTSQTVTGEKRCSRAMPGVRAAGLETTEYQNFAVRTLWARSSGPSASLQTDLRLRPQRRGIGRDQPV